MKLLSAWGITTNWWRGDRGEYWVIAQGVLLLVFALIPPITPSFIDLRLSIWVYTSLILTRKEEVWLREKFLDYANYSISIKKLIPWIY